MSTTYTNNNTYLDSHGTLKRKEKKKKKKRRVLKPCVCMEKGEALKEHNRYFFFS